MNKSPLCPIWLFSTLIQEEKVVVTLGYSVSALCTINLWLICGNSKLNMGFWHLLPTFGLFPLITPFSTGNAPRSAIVALLFLWVVKERAAVYRIIRVSKLLFHFVHCHFSVLLQVWQANVYFSDQLNYKNKKEGAWKTNNLMHSVFLMPVFLTLSFACGHTNLRISSYLGSQEG